MKFFIIVRTGLFAAVLSVVSSVAAQDTDSINTYSLEEFVVSARRIQMDVIPVQTLSGQLLENLSAHSVADALRYFSGVQLKDYGGIGGLKTVNVRSMGSQHVGVFYDGIEIDNPQNGVVDLGRYSLDNIEAVSLYNGQKSAIFQPAKDYASASSIYMNAKIPAFEGEKKRNIKFTFKTGSFDLINPSLYWEQKLSDKLSSSVNFDYTNSSGKYKFRYIVDNKLDDRGGYDTTAVRQNGDIQLFRLEQALFGKIKDGEWKTRLYFYASERGYPGAIVKEEPGRFKHEDRQKDRNIFLQTSIRKRITDSYSIRLSGKYAYDYLYYESDTLIQKLRNTYMLHDFYISSANLFGILPFWTANISADFQWNKMNSDIKEFIYPQRWSGWIAAATSFDLQRLKIQASILGTFVHETTREDKKDIQRDWQKVTPTVMASWQPFHEEQLFLRAFYKDIFRMPTFAEMHLAYMGSLSSYLKPEFTKQHNIGILYSKNVTPSLYMQGQVDAYYNEVTDKLLAVPGGVNFRWTMMNVGFVKIKGMDMSLSATNRFNKELTIDAQLNYTWQKAQDYSPITVESDTITYRGQIAYIPTHSGSAILSAAYRSWTLSYSFIYTGERFTGSANIARNRLQPWYTSDLALGRSFRWNKSDLKATVEVNNLFNQAYDVVLNYPMPGTNYKFILNITL
ncbi:TonB-dependent receptor [Proteiniphilum acetatigenes]|uniref:TonB-dependent receptor n=1 Tax=Proteiniphilum acetatigenes TaxID=294710 RepID=UPI000368065E|nr:TonB-dependent receptor plug domain-containing protein [Proteiniphilum acetatigenes]